MDKVPPELQNREQADLKKDLEFGFSGGYPDTLQACIWRAQSLLSLKRFIEAEAILEYGRETFHPCPWLLFYSTLTSTLKGSSIQAAQWHQQFARLVQNNLRWHGHQKVLETAMMLRFNENLSLSIARGEELIKHSMNVDFGPKLVLEIVARTSSSKLFRSLNTAIASQGKELRLSKTICSRLLLSARTDLVKVFRDRAECLNS